jgi:two-component system response regulator DesR
VVVGGVEALCRREQAAWTWVTSAGSPDAAAPIRLILADDHAITREPLRAFLEVAGGYEVLAEAADGDEALRLTCELRPDVLLLDVVMPGLDGLRVAELLRDVVPETRVILLSGYDPAQYVGAAARVGAAGYVGKTAGFDELARAIRTVHEGGTYFPTLAAEPAVSPYSSPTSREVEVLRLVERGLRNSQIADELAISETTVQFHLRQLFGKLHATSRTEAVRRAREYGWIV